MPESRGDDLQLIAEFQAGSESAAQTLFDRYCERLMRLAKRRIGQRMASRVDPEDVIQSAFRTFFVRVRNDEFTFDGEDDLFKLLVRLTVNKALRQIAHHRAAKRDPHREAGQGTDSTDNLAGVMAHEQAPDVEVAVLDEFERFIGHKATVRTNTPLGPESNQRTFHGRITRVDRDGDSPSDEHRGVVELTAEDGHVYAISLALVRRANLVYEAD